jgi:archaetidylinositol phosphate synthase
MGKNRERNFGVKRMLVEFNKKFPDIRKKILKPFLFKCNPNTVSWFALLMAGIAGYLFYADHVVLASLFVILNGFLDILDGEIAKAYGRTSKLGDFLDHAFDRVADVLMFFGVALNPGVPLLLGSVNVIFILLVSYMGTQFQAIMNRRLYGGLFGRSDRNLFLFLFGMGTLFFKESLYYGTIIILVLSFVTFVQRFCVSYREIKKS